MAARGPQSHRQIVQCYIYFEMQWQVLGTRAVLQKSTFVNSFLLTAAFDEPWYAVKSIYRKISVNFRCTQLTA